MRCPECDHQNPAGNHFCGMCGARIRSTTASEAAAITGPVPVEVEAAPVTEPGPSPSGLFTDPRFAERLSSGRTIEESRPARMPAARAPEPDAESESELENSHSVIGGPSFLGLSDANEYSYLVEDEESGRRWLRGIIALVLLGVAGFLLSRNWTQISQWAVNQAAVYTRQSRNSTPAPTNADQGETLADNNPSQPAASGAQQPAEKQQSAAGSAGPEMKVESPQTDRAAAAGTQQAAKPAPQSSSGEKSAAEESDAEQAPPAEEKQPPSASNQRGAARSEETESAESERPVERAPSASRSQREPSSPPGEEMVVAGDRYLYGRGAPRNCNQALVYFRAGAEQQNPRALSRLGAMYATGNCVPMDRVMAYNWFSRALAHDRNNHLIEKNLNILWRDMTARERQQVLTARR